MHNAAFAALGIEWTYELLDIPPADLRSAIGRLRDPEVAGANVTIPHKLAVMDLMDGVDAEALRARAVNTIAKEGSRLVGWNNDVAAIRDALEEVGVEDRSAHGVIRRCGGASSAVTGARG